MTIAAKAQLQQFTKFGWVVCAWILIASFQYGFHISALNQLQNVLSCRTRGTQISSTILSLPPCIPMTDAEFSVVTSSFTLGGLAGSLLAPLLTTKYGRKGALRSAAFFFAGGASLLAIAASIWVLVVGRFLIGVGSGVGISVGPIFIAEIAPVQIRGSVGVLTQLSIVIGILVTQLLGVQLATPTHWRLVPLSSAVLALVQIIFAPGVAESPAWLRDRKRSAEAAKVEERIWGTRLALSEDTETGAVDDEVQDPLLSPPDELTNESAAGQLPPLNVRQLLAARELQRAVAIVSFAMLAQQFSGINAVLYYSTAILSKTLPELASHVSLLITVVNALMTFPPIFLIDRLGRKALLFISIIGAFVSLIFTGYGIDASYKVVSSIAIIVFVMSFACGMGPVPFVMISEVAPPHAVSSLSSVALSVNWISNFIVGLVFLPLRNLLSGGDPAREGYVFYVFALILAIFGFCLHRVY